MQLLNTQTYKSIIKRKPYWNISAWLLAWGFLKYTGYLVQENYLSFKHCNSFLWLLTFWQASQPGWLLILCHLDYHFVFAPHCNKKKPTKTKTKKLRSINIFLFMFTLLFFSHYMLQSSSLSTVWLIQCKFAQNQQVSQVSNMGIILMFPCNS